MINKNDIYTKIENIKKKIFQLKNYVLNIVPDQITVTQENGSFSISIQLQSFSTTYSADGFDYDFSIDTELQFCLDPVPPVGWINLQLTCELGTEYDGVNYSTGFAIECPIVSVEEEG